MRALLTALLCTCWALTASAECKICERITDHTKGERAVYVRYLDKARAPSNAFFDKLGLTLSLERYPGAYGYALRVDKIETTGALADARDVAGKGLKLAVGDYIRLGPDKAYYTDDVSKTVAAAYERQDPAILHCAVTRFRAGVDPMQAQSDSDVVFWQEEFEPSPSLFVEAPPGPQEFYSEELGMELRRVEYRRARRDASVMNVAAQVVRIGTEGAFDGPISYAKRSGDSRMQLEKDDIIPIRLGDILLFEDLVEIDEDTDVTLQRYPGRTATGKYYKSGGLPILARDGAELKKALLTTLPMDRYWTFHIARPTSEKKGNAIEYFAKGADGVSYKGFAKVLLPKESGIYSSKLSMFNPFCARLYRERGGLSDTSNACGPQKIYPPRESDSVFNAFAAGFAYAIAVGILTKPYFDAMHARGCKQVETSTISVYDGYDCTESYRHGQCVETSWECPD